MLNQLRMLAVEQLRALDDTVRLIAVHPNYVEQHVVLTEFLNQPRRTVYVRLEGSQLTVEEIWEQIGSARKVQAEGGAAVQRLILDECDRALPDAFDSVLPTLMQEMPESHIVLFSREIPQCVLRNAQLRRQAAFIPEEENFMLWDYARREEPSALLEVRAFGEGRVFLNGQPVDEWDGLLPRSLFFYLVDRGMATRSEIFETFWPNLPVREATNVFHVTKRKISEVLGIDLTTYWSGFYRISPDIKLSYDVILFTEMVNQSALLPVEESAEKLSHAVGLYQGAFLNAMDTEWAKRRRGELAQNYGEALASLAKAKEDLGEKQQALGLYLRAAAVNRHREDLAASIMRLYRELNMHIDALAVFERLSAELQSELGVMPAPQLQELAETIRAEMNAVS